MSGMETVWNRMPERIRRRVRRAVANEIQMFGETALDQLDQQRRSLSSEKEARRWALNNPDEARQNAWRTIRQRYGSLLAKSMLLTDPEVDSVEAIEIMSDDLRKFILLFFNPVIKWGLIVGHKDEVREDVASDFAAIGEDAIAVLEMLAQGEELSEEDLPPTARVVLEESSEIAREVQGDD